MQVINTAAQSNGSTISTLQVAGTARHRAWGIFQVQRVVRIAPGVTYKNSRTPGVEVLHSFEFDARSAKQTAAATAAAKAAFIAATGVTL